MLRLFIVLIAVWLTANTIAAWFSIDPLLSWQGEYGRYEGIMTLIAYAIFALLLINYFYENSRSEYFKRIKPFLYLLTLSSTLVSLYAVLQAGGIDYYTWSETARITSTLGQPNNLASLILISIWPAVYLAAIAPKWLLKSALLISIGLQLSALYFTFSTAAWLGFAASAVVAAYWFINNKKIKINKVLASTLLLLSLIFIYYSDSPLVRQRLDNLLNWGQGSTSARLQFWASAMEQIPERWFLGYGPDTQREVLLQGYAVDWAVPSNVNVMPSRAHNLFLDAWLASGLLGVLSLLALWSFLFYLVWRNWQKDRSDWWNLSLFSALFAQFIYLQFNYWHISAYVYFWLLFSLLVLYSSLQKKQGEMELGLVSSGRHYFRYIFAGLAVFVVVWAVNYYLRFIGADHYFREMQNAAPYNQYTLTYEFYDYIVERFGHYKYYDERFAVFADKWNKEFDNDLFYTMSNERLVPILADTKADTFHDVLTRNYIYASLAAQDDSYQGRAELELQRLKDLSPHLPLVYRTRALYYLDQGRYEPAIAEFQTALSKLPPLNSPGLNLEHKNAIIKESLANYQGLKKVYREMGEEERVVEIDKVIIELSSQL